MGQETRRHSTILVIVLMVAVILSGSYLALSTTRAEKLYSLADKRSHFLFASFEAMNLGGFAVSGVIIESPSLIVIVDSVEDFVTFINGSTVYTMEEPWSTSKYNGTNNFSDYRRVLETSYIRTYYVFNDEMTIAWRYTHTINFKVQLRD